MSLIIPIQNFVSFFANLNSIYQKFFTEQGVQIQLHFIIFATRLSEMVTVAQLVRASDCGSEGRRFEPG